MSSIFYRPLATCLFCCLLQLVGTAQETDTIITKNFPAYYRIPLDLPLSLSGNYGEFRSNHFHTGYDMRIGGVVGAKVFAAAEGFISRITVSPGGYGNALYIDHPNGTTTLYGHLLDFASAIQEYVKEKQYEMKSFSVDLSLTPEQFPVEKGDFVGRAGNSGASGGPHLHFEIRNTETQGTMNYSDYGLFPVTDNTPPRLTRLHFWGYSIQAGIPRTALIKAVDIASPPQLIAVSDTFYVAMGALDRMEGSYATLALSAYELYIDDVMVYRYKKKNIPPSMGRYLNSFLQYNYRVKSDQTLLKTWVEPGNMVKNLVETSHHGLFSLADTLTHALKIVIRDDYGNESVYRYLIAKRKSVQMVTMPLQGNAVMWAMDNYYETEDVQLYLPFGALGKNIDFVVKRIEPPLNAGRNLYAPLWRIGSTGEPLLRPMRLAIRAHVPLVYREKAVVVSIDRDGRSASAGGRWNGDFLETNTYNFGDYTVTIDTVPPRITPKFTGTYLRNVKQIGFYIRDDLSGIKSYEGYIDGVWALFEYDAKYASLYYVFDKKRVGSGKNHQLELMVTDNCNNTVIYKTSFIW